MKIRLDKYLADMGCGTRSQVKRGITKGGAEVNGVKVTRPEEKIDTERDTVLFNGMTVGYAEFEYYMLNKPAGVVSATEDRRERTVLDLIGEKRRKDLFPVGRLDKDTEGLLLITNDGELAHRLLSPKKHVDKTYYARVAGRWREGSQRSIRRSLPPEWTSAMRSRLSPLNFGSFLPKRYQRLNLRSTRADSIR